VGPWPSRSRDRSSGQKETDRRGDRREDRHNDEDTAAYAPIVVGSAHQPGRPSRLEGGVLFGLQRHVTLTSQSFGEGSAGMTGGSEKQETPVYTLPTLQS
jgi:hypothetical protein